jgi:hypothetical protein
MNALALRRGQSRHPVAARAFALGEHGKRTIETDEQGPVRLDRRDEQLRCHR